ncbi:4-hydroxymandelate oxidase [bacterium MnTg02]|nr:4-hydroxymandelate oxidase [bacterium MnTg02]
MSIEERFKVLHEFVKPARTNLKSNVWDYLMGGSETETTYKRNRQALDTLALCPRVLRNVETIETGTEVLGQKLRLPVILAPIGSFQDIVPEGGVAPAKAAARANVLHMLSSSCQPSMEEVAASIDYPKIFQLYVRGDTAWVDDMISRAIASGYFALCLTVDLDYYGRRERDIAKRHLPTARLANTGDQHQARFSWPDIERIRSKFDIPLILKGIAMPEDAVRAVEHGVACVYVSNHGGRQLDHGLGAMACLPDIVEAVAGRAEIIVDGGFMRGTDIVKALALGANAVGIGRLQGLAAAAAGEDGMVRMVEILTDEVERCLGLLGVTSFNDLDSSYVKTAPPVTEAGAFSAFPLLDEGY